MQFTPFSIRRHEEWKRNNPPDPDVALITSILAQLLAPPFAKAMDVYPEQGAISFRDGKGQMWEIAIAKSDAPYLVCEGKKP